MVVPPSKSASIFLPETFAKDRVICEVSIRGGPLDWLLFVSNPNGGQNNQLYRGSPHFYE